LRQKRREIYIIPDIINLLNISRQYNEKQVFQEMENIFVSQLLKNAIFV